MKYALIRMIMKYGTMMQGECFINCINTLEKSKEYISLRLNNQWYLGGLDDNAIVIWNVAEGKPICGLRVALEYTYLLRFFNNSDESFKIRNLNNQQIWIIDYKNSKLFSNEINQGHIRRIRTTAVICNDDQYAYPGSTTGDIVAIDIPNYYIKHFVPVKDKDKLQAGISQLELFNLGDKGAAIVAGSGNGEVVLYKVNYPLKEKISLLDTLGRTAVLGKITILKIQPNGYGLATKTMKRSMSPKQTGAKKTAVPTRGPSRKVDVNGRVIPIATAERPLIPRQKDAIRPSGTSCEQKGPLFDLTVATDQSIVYSIIVPTMDAELVRSSYCNSVRGIQFAQSSSMIFTSCSYHDITLWHLRSGNELVRIEVPNVTCLCVCFNLSRTEMISRWSDRKIRSFGPESGRIQHVIGDVYKEVSSITTFHNSPAIVSGGSEGQVRLWKLGCDNQQLVATMKEHNMPVTALRMIHDDLECVSSRSDGQMLTWSLTHNIHLKQLINTTNIQVINYLPYSSQFIACGSDRFATFFDAFEGKQLCKIELSDKELFDIAVIKSRM
ncbi:MAG: putative Cilia- and flagella-associated protein 52, partial [Streblomastix strix]